jgi:hypothetical protein
LLCPDEALSLPKGPSRKGIYKFPRAHPGVSHGNRLAAIKPPLEVPPLGGLLAAHTYALSGLIKFIDEWHEDKKCQAKA